MRILLACGAGLSTKYFNEKKMEKYCEDKGEDLKSRLFL